MALFVTLFIIAALTGMPLVSYLSLYVRDNARQQAGVIWSTPVEGQCLEYGSRSYSAKLLNYPIDKYWQEACERTPMVVQGKEIRKTCELAVNAVTAHWQSNDVGSGCRPSWGPVENEYCSGSDKIISTRLMHVKNDRQWEVMCQTTPFHIYGMTKFAMSCENKGLDGVWGYLALDNDEGCMAQERIKQREEAGVTWSVPQPGSCVQYGVQEHSATLLHYEVDEYWNEACEMTELTFNDQRFKSPAQCKILGNVYNKRVIGYWHVMNQSPECATYWISIFNEHCVGTHKRMVSARLWNLQNRNRWDAMCSTTPLTLQNVSQVPLSCENKGIWGIWGHWEILDESCAMLVEG